jgi:3-dehydroquinate synthase
MRQARYCLLPKGFAVTAPLRADPTLVNVALGTRTYDIVIGRGQIATLGTRAAALKPGARAAIVTDDTVAGLHLDAAEAALAAAGVASSRIAVPAGEASRASPASSRSAKR